MERVHCVLCCYTLSKDVACNSCLGLCPEPGGIPHSTRTGYNGPYTQCSNVTYSCHGGGGGGAISCQRNGTWTQKPSCQGKFVHGRTVAFWNGFGTHPQLMIGTLFCLFAAMEAEDGQTGVCHELGSCLFHCKINTLTEQRGTQNCWISTSTTCLVLTCNMWSVTFTVSVTVIWCGVGGGVVAVLTAAVVVAAIRHPRFTRSVRSTQIIGFHWHSRVKWQIRRSSKYVLSFSDVPHLPDQWHRYHIYGLLVLGCIYSLFFKLPHQPFANRFILCSKTRRINFNNHNQESTVPPNEAVWCHCSSLVQEAEGSSTSTGHRGTGRRDSTNTNATYRPGYDPHPHWALHTHHSHHSRAPDRGLKQWLGEMAKFRTRFICFDPVGVQHVFVWPTESQHNECVQQPVQQPVYQPVKGKNSSMELAVIWTQSPEHEHNPATTLCSPRISKCKESKWPTRQTQLFYENDKTQHERFVIIAIQTNWQNKSKEKQQVSNAISTKTYTARNCSQNRLSTTDSTDGGHEPHFLLQFMFVQKQVVGFSSVQN